MPQLTKSSHVFMQFRAQLVLNETNHSFMYWMYRPASLTSVKGLCLSRQTCRSQHLMEPSCDVNKYGIMSYRNLTPCRQLILVWTVNHIAILNLMVITNAQFVEWSLMDTPLAFRLQLKTAKELAPLAKVLMSLSVVVSCNYPFLQCYLLLFLD